MLFLLKGAHALGAVAYPPSDSATTLRNLLALKAAGYSDITLVETTTGSPVDVDGFIEWLSGDA